jgi:hypothetical protein
LKVEEGKRRRRKEKDNAEALSGAKARGGRRESGKDGADVHQESLRANKHGERN